MKFSDYAYKRPEFERIKEEQLLLRRRTRPLLKMKS